MRPEKEAITEEMRDRLASSDFVILADYMGLTVEQSQSLRQRLRKADARMLVTKNRLLAHAARSASLEQFAAAVQDGPTALIHGPIACATWHQWPSTSGWRWYVPTTSG